jgi:hypothetical protein
MGGHRVRPRRLARGWPWALVAFGSRELGGAQVLRCLEFLGIAICACVITTVHSSSGQRAVADDPVDL